jgi:hypothetical protein
MRSGALQKQELRAGRGRKEVFFCVSFPALRFWATVGRPTGLDFRYPSLLPNHKARMTEVESDHPLEAASQESLVRMP